jgi:hypothetical protein
VDDFLDHNRTMGLLILQGNRMAARREQYGLFYGTLRALHSQNK